MSELTAQPIGEVAQPEADVTVESILNQKPVEQPPAEPATEEPADDKPEEPKRELTAEEKKLENALSYRKKQEARYRKDAEAARQENETLRKQLEKFAPKEQPKTEGAPKEEDFKTYADYLEARTDWKLEQRLTAQESKQKESRQTEEDSRFLESRIPDITAKRDAIAKTNPEIMEVVNSYTDTLDRLHPTLAKMLIEADNPTLAAHYLATEGVLDNIASMSLEDARVEFRLAQKMQITPPKQQTKAPAPLPASRGSVPASKPLEKLTALEAHKLLSQKD